MKKLLPILLLSFLFLNHAYSQCRYKGVPGKLKRYCVSDTKPSPDVATGLSVIFDKMYFVGQAGFAKAGGQYYLYLHMARNMSKAFDLHHDDPLTLTTASGNEITVYPAGNYSGKRMVSWYALGCYYSLTNEQMEVLAKEKVQSILLNVSSETEMATTSDDGHNGWQKDAQGNVFFRHEIEAAAKKERLMAAANCLLIKG